jgi:two-component system phosphate regulon sensor histidine kinase PhoR
MPNLKNPTPLSLTIISSLGVALFASLFFIFYGNNITETIIVFFIIFIISFAIFYLSLRHFIYRKIKVIYKTIFDFKNTKDTVIKDKLDLSKDILSNTENDVKHWIETKSKEITRLKEQEKFRREFLANVSHELRTPIFNILGYLETLYEGGINDVNISKDYLKKALKNVERLEAIISDLEKISSLESGSTNMEFENFEIKKIINDVFEIMSYKAKKKNIKLSFKRSCSFNAIVHADKEKIKEVLINLVSNAISYGKEGGVVLAGCYDMDQKILVEISDNGIGIPNEHLPYIFNRFYRVDKNRSRKDGGTGLGLSIVKHIIEAHNQKINVRSTVGVGTTFGFTLDKAK